jgi:hypothetical protein
MPAKDPEKRRATVRAWYARTKQERRTSELVEHQRKTKLARRHQIADWLAELKAKLICARCSEDHPGCLQFHHADPAKKEMTVAEAVRRAWSRERILSELAKCEVLCANCHAKHHAKERTA